MMSTFLGLVASVFCGYQMLPSGASFSSVGFTVLSPDGVSPARRLVQMYRKALWGFSLMERNGGTRPGQEDKSQHSTDPSASAHLGP